MKPKSALALLLLPAAAALLLALPGKYEPLAAGNPSGAGTLPANYLVRKASFSLSYNADTRTPNWVSWRLVASDLGHAPRGPWHADTTLPFPPVRPGDYEGSSFDRGHMIPADDRSASAAAEAATFVMVNVVGQTPALNRGPWKALEEHCRSLARQGHTLYIVAGPHGARGKLAGGIVVPARCWKVVADGGERFGVVMPNTEGVQGDWRAYRTTVGAVERLTGYRFFDQLPEAK